MGSFTFPCIHYALVLSIYYFLAPSTLYKTRKKTRTVNFQSIHFESLYNLYKSTIGAWYVAWCTD